MGRLEKIPTASRSTAQILAEGFKDCFPKDGEVGGLLVLSGPPDINLKGKNPNALNRTRVPAKGGITVGKQGNWKGHDLISHVVGFSQVTLGILFIHSF